MRARDFAQFLQVYAFAHVGEFEAQRFAIDLIALLAAGIFSVVVRGHFCLSKSLVSRDISEVSSLFHSLPVRSAVEQRSVHSVDLQIFSAPTWGCAVARSPLAMPIPSPVCRLVVYCVCEKNGRD
jgi:hypothetical protein